ncbi:hypothetical protein [Prescottella equi]|uniref:hypothetical protein n=1 Tax=Rhodococcus hoagii TaxID=43767 RepID=UPI000A118F9C|nr:hypothetical protein [Prescottella equi]ORJ99853.1 hypothetical protein A6F58_00655 [Prescottella equi]
MNQQDELSNLIFESIRKSGSSAVAAEAVFAAGYSRPRVVETIEELESLPAGSVILDGDTVPYERVGSEWIGCDAGDVYRDGGLLRLPATVVHLPEEKP